MSQNTIHYWHLLCGHLSLGGRWALNQSSEAGLSTAVPLSTADTTAQSFAGVHSPRSYVVESQRVLLRILFVFQIYRCAVSTLCLSETAGPSVSEVMPRGWLCCGCLSPEGPPFVLAELGTAALQGLRPVPPACLLLTGSQAFRIKSCCSLEG